MGSVELRSKLIEQFNDFIQDDTKLLALDGIFDALKTKDSTSTVPEKHYKIVEERHQKRLAGETSGATWYEVKLQLKKKYGL